MIANAGEILHAAPADEHNRVLLQVMTLVRDVRDDFIAVGEANLRDLTNGGVRLLRRASHDLNTHSAAEGIPIQCRGFRLGGHLAAALAHELVDGRHTEKEILRVESGEKGTTLHRAQRSARTFWRNVAGIANSGSPGEFAEGKALAGRGRQRVVLTRRKKTVDLPAEFSSRNSINPALRPARTRRSARVHHAPTRVTCPHAFALGPSLPAHCFGAHSKPRSHEPTL